MKRRALAWLILVVGMMICRGGYVDDFFYNVDEAEYAVAADALAEGLLPGVDLLGSTKPPGIAVLYSLLFDWFGRSPATLHVAQIVLMILLGAVVVEAAILLWGVVAAVPAAMLFWMVSNSFSLPSEILALNVEIPGTLLAMAALALVIRGSGATSWLVSGMLLGCAILFRQSLLVFLIPILVAGIHGRGRRACWTALMIGFLIPPAAVAAVYAGRGGLTWALDSWFRYPADYASDVGVAGFFEAMVRNLLEFVAQVWVVILFAALGKIVLWRKRSEPSSRIVLGLILASFLALCAGSRFYGHYFVQVFPVVALAGVPAWLSLNRRPKWGKRPLIVLVWIGAALALAHYPLWRYWDPGAPDKGVSPAQLSARQADSETAEFLRKHTDADDRVVVWGYCPQIYYHSRRLPGVRDFLCHYITGFSAGSFDPQESRAFRDVGHPRAEEMFVEDLQRTRPEFFVDISGIRDYEYTFYHYPVILYPTLTQYLREHYSHHATVAGVMVYRRTSDSDLTPTPVTDSP